MFIAARCGRRSIRSTGPNEGTARCQRQFWSGRPPAIVPPATSTACLQLYIDTAVFNFNVTLDPDVYPYTITGGTITGSICGAPWTVTGGSLGTNLSIKGQRAPVPSCSSTISVIGKFDVPDSYIGTYGFDGSSNSFNHHTLFLGYGRPNCP
jgi:hypothetical protein